MPPNNRSSPKPGPPARLQPGRRLRLGPRLSPVDGVIATHGLSSFCLGLAMPYTAIYLADKPGVGTTGVALFYGASGVANLVVALLLSTGLVATTHVRLGTLGTLLWLIGYLGVPFVGSFPTVMATAAFVGAGQGCFMAAIIPIVNALITPDQRRAVFARRYAVLNATLAAGSLVAGVLTIVLPRSVMPYFFLANAIGILPLTVAILAVRRRVREHEQTAEAGTGDQTEPDGEAGPAMPMLTLWKVVLPAALFELAASLFAFSQFEATAPLVTTDLMSMPLYTVSLMLVVNVVVIIASQRTVTRRLENRPETTGLNVAVTLWVAGYAVAGALAFSSYGVRLTGLLVYAVLFGLGECAYSCSFYPWLISMTPKHALTRANALVNSMTGVGRFAGPSIGVVLATSGNATLVWLGLAGGCTAVAVISALLQGHRKRPAALAATDPA